MAVTIRETICFNIDSVEHRDKQVCQRDLLVADKLMQKTVLESEVIAAGELDRVIFGAVGDAVDGGAPLCVIE